MANVAPSQKILLEHFEYHESGRLVWKKNVNPRYVGKFSGSKDNRGYMRVTFLGKAQPLHRLTWIFLNGAIPDGMEIDHINGVRSDNRISNLRLATRKTNMLNLQGAHLDSHTGFLGVTLHKCGKYQAQFNSKYLGLYPTPQEAHAAYLQYKKEFA